MSLPPAILEQVVMTMCARIDLCVANSPRANWYETDYIRELVTCILSSRVPFNTAVAFASQLDRVRLLEPKAWYSASGPVDDRIQRTLSAPIAIGGKSVRYRFPHLRAHQLTRARLGLRREGGLKAILEAETDSSRLRATLVRVIHGMGPKQASMFLRNIGRSENLAILDSHVMRYGQFIGLFTSAQTPAKTHYERLEEVFRQYSRRIGYSVSCVDSAIWLTMKAAMGLV